MASLVLYTLFITNGSISWEGGNPKLNIFGQPVIGKAIKMGVITLNVPGSFDQRY